MKTLFAIGAIAVALTSGTVAGVTHADTTGILSADLQAVLDGATDTVERRGRGRGGDDRVRDDRRGGGGGHGGRPRTPGGSGCDDPGDIPEHPECRI